jgi:hypothetical protein
VFTESFHHAPGLLAKAKAASHTEEKDMKKAHSGTSNINSAAGDALEDSPLDPLTPSARALVLP